MSELMRIDAEYRKWIHELGNRYRNSQIKAAIKVNNEMLMFYWSIGKEISEKYYRLDKNKTACYRNVSKSRS